MFFDFFYHFFSEKFEEAALKFYGYRQNCRAGILPDVTSWILPTGTGQGTGGRAAERERPERLSGERNRRGYMRRILMPAAEITHSKQGLSAL